MNTTYDSKFRLKALTGTMDETLGRWKRVEPTLSQIANAVKGWQQDVENILYTEEYNIQATKNAQLSLEEAWHHRDNRNLALKAAMDATIELKAAIKSAQEVEDEFVPAYVKKSMGYAMKSVKKVEPGEVEVGNWIKDARTQLREIEMVPQNNRQYIAMNANLEGEIYHDTTSRVKAWLHGNVDSVYNDVTEESRSAIKSINQILTEIEQASGSGYLNRQEKEQIFINVGKAYKMLDQVKLAPRTPAIKADLLHDVDRVRGAIDSVMPMLQSGQYDEGDLFRDVMVSINEVRRLGNALPYKSLPEDTMDNVQKADKALGIILTDKRGSIRIKALQAAAANIDIIASDLAMASRDQRGVSVKSFFQTRQLTKTHHTLIKV